MATIIDLLVQPFITDEMKEAPPEVYTCNRYTQSHTMYVCLQSIYMNTIKYKYTSIRIPTHTLLLIQIYVYIYTHL